MEQGFRKSNLTLPLPSALAVLVAASTFIATAKGRISHAQLSLSDTGTGAGSTQVAVKVNGTAITPAGGIAIAGAAATKAAVVPVNGFYPGGALVNPGDVVTVDVVAVPATTLPKQASVILEITQIDV